MGFKGELKRLQGSLHMIQAVLRDAERRQVTDEAVKLWLKNLKDVAHVADNVLDEFAYEILRRKVEIRNQMKRKVGFFFSLSNNPIAFRCQMAHKIKAINMSLEMINKEANDFGLQRERGGVDHVAPHQVTVDRETHQYLDDSKIIGREADASKIVDMLTSNQEDVVSVIPIVGMGGLGKTTLAKLIHNHEKIKSHFAVRVWVCVSENFDVNRLLREILYLLQMINVRDKLGMQFFKNLKKCCEGKNVSSHLMMFGVKILRSGMILEVVYPELIQPRETTTLS